MIQKIINFFKPKCKAIGIYLIDDSEHKCQLLKGHDDAHFATFKHSGYQAELIWKDAQIKKD